MKRILGDLEQKIMDIVWDSQKPLKPAEVKDQISKKLAYTTVMTILKRLTDKKLLTREKKGKVYYYSPAKKRASFARSKLQELFDSLVSSYGELAISQFINSVKSNPEDLKILKEYLDKGAKK